MISTASTQVFHRHLQRTPPVAVSGKGIYLTDAQGRRYIDASGGAAVSCLGHAHPDVLAAMHAQIDKLAYAHTSFFTTEVAETLARKLIETAPSGMSHVYFVSGGSEAMEATLKMARQYFVEIGQPQRKHFIARRQSYHGNTLGALAIGGNQWRREPFAPILIPVTHLSPATPIGNSNRPKRLSNMASVWRTSWSKPFLNKAPTRLSHSSRRPWGAQRPVYWCQCPVTSRQCVRCATATAYC